MLQRRRVATEGLSEREMRVLITKEHRGGGAGRRRPWPGNYIRKGKEAGVVLWAAQNILVSVGV